MHYLIAALILIIFLSRKKSSEPSNLGEFHPVYQTISKKLPNGKLIGNCFPACVASLLGLSLNEVPFFSMASQKAQLKAANEWLKPRGLNLMHISNNRRHQHPRGTTYYIMKGLSPRYKGAYHTVIGKDNKIVHDPHPDNTGIVGPPISFFYLVTL
jgi:hypothetical protein